MNLRHTVARLNPFRRWDTSLGSGRSSRTDAGRGLTGGGIVNPSTGMGTGLDHSQSSFFTPTRFYWSAPLEILCVESWAARNFVDIPINDMFHGWRIFTDASDAHIDAMTKVEADLKVVAKLRQAMKAARQYGTGVLVMMTKEAPMESPLIAKRIRPGDLTNLLVLNRFELSVQERDLDMHSPTYLQPLSYQLHPTRGEGRLVHASRVIRFDGITSASDSGFTRYEQDWGVSDLVPLINTFLQDETVVSAIAHLTHEASIPVLRVNQLREALAGGTHEDDPDAPNIDDIGRSVNQTKSIHRLLMLDKEKEDFDRIAVQFGGLGDLMDKFPERVAAAARIPRTRWLGSSPGGLNATGDSDMDNYVMSIETHRDDLLSDPLRALDAVLAPHAGIGPEPLMFAWVPLREQTEEQKAKGSLVKVQAVREALDGRFIDEDEGREMLDGDPTFGTLEGPAPEPDPALLDPATNPFMDDPDDPDDPDDGDT